MEEQRAFEVTNVMGRECLAIRNYDEIPPFFISIVSDEDHWMFLSSLGGITAGRKNPDHALFPYYTEDKIADGSHSTGSNTVITGEKTGSPWVWEPFSIRSEGRYDSERNLYKSIWGDLIIFEEVNVSLGLTFRYAWMTGGRYGFIRKSELVNRSGNSVHLGILDGIHNILPYGATAQTQNEYSCLIDGYKENRRIHGTNIAAYRMSSLLTDKAEPSESLRATVVWTTLNDVDTLLLSDSQVKDFRSGKTLSSETQIRGCRGAYYTVQNVDLRSSAAMSWYTVADVDQTQVQVQDLVDRVSRSEDLQQALDADINKGTRNLRNYVGLSDGLQSSSSRNVTIHHFANTLFNIMRGGIFPDGYTVDTADFLSFLNLRNIPVAQAIESEVAEFPKTLNLRELKEWVGRAEDPNLTRLFMEYLPLTFSRRHGDPSRPWNKFSIDIRDDSGGRKMNYQGNWRDIFQNWEALLFSFPEYIPHVVAKFLNAITPDGYNPYRITRAGIEWEVPEPDNPWSNIGYWGDHQVIYLQRLLESWELFEPGVVEEKLNLPRFSHADVPYTIRSYDEIIKDPRDTIDFDTEKDTRINERVKDKGSDGRLVHNSAGEIVHSSLFEKLLTIIVAKISNFVPGGGIWMNTQRPEWNDANNALVGPGISVVTLCYLRRMVVFLTQLLDSERRCVCPINTILDDHFTELRTSLDAGKPEEFFDPIRRKELMDRLGSSATRFRQRLASDTAFESATERGIEDVIEFFDLVVRHIDATLAASRRNDGLYDSYKLLVLEDDRVGIRKLQVMLEGQVAVLSSGFLDSRSSLSLLEALEASPLYRADQDSYILYPNRELPDFLEKNCIPPGAAERIPMLAAMEEAGDDSVVVKDVFGTYRFHADFRNAGDLSQRLDQLSNHSRWKADIEESRQDVLDLYEEVFDHASFTGRSGTFFAYEGLGSIYWHMVSKLLLAVQEAAKDALERQRPEAEQLVHRYYRVRSGLSFNKSPENYGAFVTDPYSHTPAGSGAKQPGMTGQVKEELLTRWGELGVEIVNGRLRFQPRILADEEYLDSSETFEFVDASGRWSEMDLSPGSLAFTYCGVPIRYDSQGSPALKILFEDGSSESRPETVLSRDESRSVFRREGRIKEIQVGTG